MRARQISDDVAYAGALLDVYSQAASTPGSALCVVATDQLAAHRVTGQSFFEDANVATQLVWWDRMALSEIDPSITPDAVSAMTVFEATAFAERMPMGTLTSPRADEDALQPLVERFNQAKREGLSTESIAGAIDEALEAQVRPIWNALWSAHRRLAALPVTISAEDRWATDARTYGLQLTWLDGGGRRRYSDSPMQAARLLSAWESSQTAMIRDAVIEDDLALVEAVLDGKAFVGTVLGVEVRKLPGTKHPFITLRVRASDISEGTSVWWRPNTKVEGIVRRIAEHPDHLELEIEVVVGMQKNAMPTVGIDTAFITLEPPFAIRPKPPREAPWTHVAIRTEQIDDADD